MLLACILYADSICCCVCEALTSHVGPCPEIRLRLPYVLLLALLLVLLLLLLLHAALGPCNACLGLSGPACGCVCVPPLSTPVFHARPLSNLLRSCCAFGVPTHGLCGRVLEVRAADLVLLHTETHWRCV